MVLNEYEHQLLPETNHHDTLLGIHGYKWYSMKGLLLCGE